MKQASPQASTSSRKTVMVSSTARDLPEHRKEVLDACLRQGMFPIMMEHLPASDSDAIAESLRMVDQADIYLGVFAHRYGYIPKGHNISITEMEYKRAVDRRIPRLIFIIDKKHPIQIDDVEMGEGAAKLKTVKERLLAENIVNSFNSPADLRAHVINSLSAHRQPDLTAFHYVSRQTREDIQKLPPPEREAQLLSILDREPFLFVLDGLERLLIAYARMDAARMADDDLDQRTANFVAGALGLPESAEQTFTGQDRLRKTADLRTGAFLRKLATVHSARILISTRLYPADLQMDTAAGRSGCAATFLHHLSADDALNLWRAFGISGSREAPLPLFHTVDDHPLLIQ